MPSVPHFALPFRQVGNSFATVEQDSIDEIAQCVYSVLSTRIGEWIDEPEFGVRAQNHRKGGANLQELRAAAEEWEPRASVLTDAQFAGVVERVMVHVSS